MGYVWYIPLIHTRADRQKKISERQQSQRELTQIVSLLFVMPSLRESVLGILCIDKGKEIGGIVKEDIQVWFLLFDNLLGK